MKNEKWRKREKVCTRLVGTPSMTSNALSELMNCNCRHFSAQEKWRRDPQWRWVGVEAMKLLRDLEDEDLKLRRASNCGKNQKNSQKNRRKLTESSRDFKKASPEEKVGLFNSLLKEEVDNLTKRAKFAENAFPNIYQKLYEAPDPYPALASIPELDTKISELESENRKMKVELEEFKAEAAYEK
ncbi:hypothetical protein Cgig2_014242 [Carnegiea gigantea]|uniref:Cux N-terminal domain-containing protein n=1 Tax=Carnegiea gigantea TaxID=171969 RepID=A0A9Q1K0U5_9CARY|nr:hypothetical protein Cgig2_014242 [Carnegiea gigantea]